MSRIYLQVAHSHRVVKVKVHFDVSEKIAARVLVRETALKNLAHLEPFSIGRYLI